MWRINRTAAAEEFVREPERVRSAVRLPGRRRRGVIARALFLTVSLAAPSWSVKPACVPGVGEPERPAVGGAWLWGLRGNRSAPLPSPDGRDRPTPEGAAHSTGSLLSLPTANLL